MPKKPVTYKRYQILCPIDTPRHIRIKYNIGDIFENKARCLGCGEIIISENVHDCVTCSCGQLSVDGGSWYLKRSGNIMHYEELYVMYADAVGYDATDVVVPETI